jgi:hypothetical protein
MRSMEKTNKFLRGEAREPDRALIGGMRVVPKEQPMPETANRIESLFAAAVALPPAHGDASIFLTRDEKCSRLLTNLALT